MNLTAGRLLLSLDLSSFSMYRESRMMHKIIILGPQGSGKGTQAKLLSQKLGIPTFSMGQLLRDEIATGSELGKQINEILLGEHPLVSDNLALDTLKTRMAKGDTDNGYIIDGYPRDLAQYALFTQFDQPTAVVLIDIPYEESIKRLTKRAETESRTDDTPELIKRRLDIYKNETMPVVEKYREAGLLKIIDGMGTIEEVQARINAALEI